MKGVRGALWAKRAGATPGPCWGGVREGLLEPSAEVAYAASVGGGSGPGDPVRGMECGAVPVDTVATSNSGPRNSTVSGGDRQGEWVGGTHGLTLPNLPLRTPSRPCLSPCPPWPGPWVARLAEGSHVHR